MKKLKYIVGAWIFHDQSLLLVFHKKLNKWLPVGGHVEENESFDDALLREVLEETNLEVSFLEYYNFFNDLPSNISEFPKPFRIHSKESDDFKTLIFDFLCVAKDISKLKILEDELSDHKFFTEKEILDSNKLSPVIKKLSLKAFKEYKIINL